MTADPKPASADQQGNAHHQPDSTEADASMETQVQETAHILTRDGTPLDPGRIADFCKHHHIRRLSLIHKVEPGSRGANDWDMLVEFGDGKSPSIFELVAMEIELCNMAQRRVDLRTMDQLRPTTSSKLLGAAIPVFVS